MKKNLSGIERLMIRANMFVPQEMLLQKEKNIPDKDKLICDSINKDKIALNYDICVIITTYNREKFLHRLLNDIEKNKLCYKILIFVFDDASENMYEMSKYDVEYIKYSINNGKTKYWKLITDTMQICKLVNSKYFIYLPDDVTLEDDFFSKSITLFESIQDENKICLSLLMTKQQMGKINWTNFKPINYNEKIYKTQWCDMCFISEKRMFEELNYRINVIPKARWYGDRFKTLGSGVGEELSRRLFNKNLNMYHVKKTLVHHSDHESVMNFNIRKNQKLTT